MPHFRLPDGAKPSKVASKDATRPALTQGNIRQRDGEWWLEVTDSYCLSVIPLSVSTDGDSAAREGLVSRDILLAAEKPKMGGFGFGADGTVTVYDHLGAVAQVMPNPTELDGEPVAPFPDTKTLLDSCPARSANGSLLRIGLNPQLLAAIAAAQGRGNGRNAPPVVLEVDPNAATDGRYLRAVLVTVNGSENLLMPVRTN